LGRKPKENNRPAVPWVHLEVVGLRAIVRLVGVSPNAVMNWVLAEVAGKTLARVAPAEVEWVEADELWTYVGKKNGLLALVGD
jgi:DNA-binding transcriptional regulator YdaS (Cro superfamily)